MFRPLSRQLLPPRRQSKVINGRISNVPLEITVAVGEKKIKLNIDGLNIWTASVRGKALPADTLFMRFSNHISYQNYKELMHDNMNPPPFSLESS